MKGDAAKMKCPECDKEMKDVSYEELTNYEYWNGELWKCPLGHYVHLDYDQMR